MENYLNGLIIKGVGGQYMILLDKEHVTSDGNATKYITCRARGSFRHDGESPLVGDKVILREDKNGSFMISEIKERKNSLIRPPLSNLDTLFIMFAAKSPDPVMLTIDKLISIAEHKKIDPVIIITKCDLDENAAKEYEKLYLGAGFKVFVTGEGCDFCELANFINSLAPKTISAFAGASGIGKSTLLNRLFPSLELETGEISRKVSRGKHTTRSVELFKISERDTSAYIADTPGFSMLDFERFNFFSNDELIYTFREFDDLIGKCKYTKCTHTKEEGCAVIEAVKSGKISKSRHESFVSIRDDLKNKHSWDNK